MNTTETPTPSNGVTRATLRSYEYAPVSDDELKDALAADRVMRSYALKEENYRRRVEEFVQKEKEAQAERSRIDTKICDLEALLQTTRRERREQCGVIRKFAYQRGITTQQIRQLDLRWRNREIFVHRALVVAKLTHNGKKLKITREFDKKVADYIE